MLTIIIKGQEFFDEESNSFIETKELKLELEHSLVSLSKWESKHQKPFLSTEKSNEEIYDYIKCMIISPLEYDDSDLNFSDDNLKRIREYIESDQSATTFGEMPSRNTRAGEIITSELVYYWLVAYNIPFECENWHINRLFSLVKICNIKNSKDKKMPRHQIAQRNREINERRKAELATKG